ncbi:MAG TPA: hypothetical protein VHB98_08525 [Chloroflexota bacterium]|nr:hypothetical protein [Chloroflexota bacterium]
MAGAAGTQLALPISQVPPGLQLSQAASHMLTLADIAQIADPVTADAFRRNGWQTGYEERLDGTNAASTRGCRVLIDAFVFNAKLGARISRVLWAAGTPGASTLITDLPTSAQSFQALVHTPGAPGWDVQIIIRVGQTFADVDGRCNGTDNGTLQRARALAARVTRPYNSWIAAHPPS